MKDINISINVTDSDTRLGYTEGATSVDFVLGIAVMFDRLTSKQKHILLDKLNAIVDEEPNSLGGVED